MGSATTHKLQNCICFYPRTRVYNRITSKVHHFYITFTSDLTSELFVHPPPLPGPPARAENGFSGCAGNASRPRNKLRPVHRFRMRRTSKTGLPLAARREILRYALARILMHAVKTDPARFWRVFGWFVACFTGFPSETPSEPLRRCTQRMLW